MRRIRRVYGLAMENGEAPFSRYLFKGIFMGVKSKQKKALPTESLRLLMTAPLDDSGLRNTAGIVFDVLVLRYGVCRFRSFEKE